MANIYRYDTGTMVLVNLGNIALHDSDSTSQMNIYVYILKPNGAEDIIEPEIYSYSNPAKVFFLSDASTFDQVGSYKLQSRIQEQEYVDGTWEITKQWWGDLTTFPVKARWT